MSMQVFWKEINIVKDQNPFLDNNKVFMEFYDYRKFQLKNKDWLKKRNFKIWDNIIKLSQTKKNVRIYLQTYPAEYSEVNDFIRQIADKYQLTLIDHEKLIKNLIKNDDDIERYLDGYEHSTPLGYGIMASNIFNIIQNKL